MRYADAEAEEADEVRAAEVNDGTRFTVKLALRVIGDRYSDEVLRLILSLNDNGNGKH